jgi:hypothetical protein
MSLDINRPPTQDTFTNGALPSDIWQKWFNDTFEYLRSYIGSSGITPPHLTTQQRDALTNVREGTLILNSDTNKAEMRIDGAWKVISFT